MDIPFGTGDTLQKTLDDGAACGTPRVAARVEARREHRRRVEGRREGADGEQAGLQVGVGVVRAGRRKAGRRPSCRAEPRHVIRASDAVEESRRTVEGPSAVTPRIPRLPLPAPLGMTTASRHHVPGAIFSRLSPGLSMRLSVVSAATLVAAAVVLPASGLHAQVRDTTRQARDSLRRDAARRPSARGDSASRGDTARVGAGGARDTTQRARGDSEPPSPYNGLRFRSIGPAVTSGRVVGHCGASARQAHLVRRRRVRRRVEDHERRHHLDADLRQPGVVLDRQRRHRPEEPERGLGRHR